MSENQPDLDRDRCMHFVRFEGAGNIAAVIISKLLKTLRFVFQLIFHCAGSFLISAFSSAHP